MSFINPTNFKQAMATLAETVDESFGEMLRIIPCEARPNYSPEAQEEHSVVVRGVFTTHAELALRTNGFVSRSGRNGLVETRTPIFSFARVQLPWGLQRGDRFQRCCNPDEIYEITRIESDVTSQRVTVHVVQLGVMSQ